MAVVYDLLYVLAAVASSPLWVFRLLRTGKWRTDWAARLGRCSLKPDARPTLLIHAVSVGEVNLVRLLIDQLDRESTGGWRIVVSVTTDTGTARAIQLYGAKHQVVRYPLDFSFAVRRFLNVVRPTVVALVELEVWPNFVRECATRKIPVSVINGRLSARSFKRYKLIRPFLRSIFARLSAVAAQTREYADRFITLGTPGDRVQVLDSMKWDTAQVAEPAAVEGAAALAKAMGIDPRKPLIVAGSTAPDEDKLIIDACPPDAQVLIVPRKPEWFDLVARRYPDIVRRTQCTDQSPRALDGKRLFLLDTIGELRKAYALADVAIVGRSFMGDLFGSDMIEPIALGKATIIGSHYGDFADMMEALIQADGIIVAANPGAAAGELLRDRAEAAALAKRGRDVILSRLGATDRHAKLLREEIGLRLEA